MAIHTNKRYPAYLTRQTGTESSTSRNDNFSQEQFFRSDPVSGGWITFPDGSKFRKPTAYSTRRFGLELKDPQEDKTFYKGKPDSARNVSTSPGGYRSDILMSSNCPSWGGISMNKLYDSPTIPRLMENEAVVKALNRIADQKAGIGENLATLQQTLGLLSHPCVSLASLLRSAWKDKSVRPYLRKKARDFHGPLDYGARKYLEYAYGWKPLVDDIYGTVQVLKNLGERPLLLSGSGTSTQQGRFSGGKYSDVSHSAITLTDEIVENVKVHCKIYGRIDPNHAGLRTLNQLGLLNPLAIAWDAMPWSFVVDWFLPIGPVFNAFSAPAGLKFVSGTISVRTSVRGKFEHYYDSWRGTSYPGSYSNATGSMYAECYKRNTYGNWPLPRAYFSSDPFTGDRPFKALALMIANLRHLR